MRVRVDGKESSNTAPLVRWGGDARHVPIRHRPLLALGDAPRNEDIPVILELSSAPLSITRFNLNPALWGHLVMRDIEVAILEVIRNPRGNRSRA